MADRIVTKVSVASRKNAYGEWVVKAYDQHGERFKEADYFTDDRKDAINTSQAMLKNALSIGGY